ncbi:hypothetical protein D3C87_1424280 [compost metagenome]
MAAGQCLQLRQALGAAAMTARRKRVEHPATAKRALRALVAKNQRVAPHGLHRRVEQQLREHLPTGGEA